MKTSADKPSGLLARLPTAVLPVLLALSLCLLVASLVWPGMNTRAAINQTRTLGLVQLQQALAAQAALTRLASHFGQVVASGHPDLLITADQQAAHLSQLLATLAQAGGPLMPQAVAASRQSQSYYRHVRSLSAAVQDGSVDPVHLGAQVQTMQDLLAAARTATTRLVAASRQQVHSNLSQADAAAGSQIWAASLAVLLFLVLLWALSQQRHARSRQRLRQRLARRLRNSQHQLLLLLDDLDRIASELQQQQARPASAQRPARQARLTGPEQRPDSADQDLAQRLIGQVTQVNTSIADLADETARVSAIADSIGQVALQTNLLALNAAIDAAQAGDEGRGYARVADYAKSLASRTEDSSRQVQQVVEQLRTSADDVARAVAEQAKAHADDQAKRQPAAAGTPTATQAEATGSGRSSNPMAHAGTDARAGAPLRSLAALSTALAGVSSQLQQVTDNLGDDSHDNRSER